MPMAPHDAFPSIKHLPFGLIRSNTPWGYRPAKDRHFVARIIGADDSPTTHDLSARDAPRTENIAFIRRATYFRGATPKFLGATQQSS